MIMDETGRFGSDGDPAVEPPRAYVRRSTGLFVTAMQKEQTR